MKHATHHAALAILLTLACAYQAVAELKVPDSPYTVREYTSDLRRFYEESLVDAYKAHGSRDPAWDDLFIRYLEATAIHWTHGEIGTRAKPYLPPDISGRWLWKTLNAVADAGCDDALFHMFYGGQLAANDRADEGREHQLLALEMMADTDWPLWLQAKTSWQIRRSMPPGEERDAYLSVARRLSAEAMFSRKPSLFARHYWIDFMKPGSSFSKAQFYWDYVQEAVDPDPWARELMAGLYHREKGWHARTGAWASEVTEEGWRIFGEELPKARDHLARAWELRPDSPLAPTALIPICMAGYGRPGDSKRLWLERAIAARFDYTPAYEAYEWAIRPRWGGSHQEMVEFARDCVDTGAFHTGVPGRLSVILGDIASESDGEWVFDRDEEIWKLVDQYFTGLLAEPARQHQRLDLLSEYAGYAWRFGKFAKARQLLNQLGTRNALHDLSWSRGSRDRITDQSYARSGVAADRFAQGDAAFGQRRFDAARGHYQAAMETAGLHPLSNRYARHRLQQIRWQQRLEAGETISLIPDADLRDAAADRGVIIGLDTSRGKWEIREDALLGISRNWGMEAQFTSGAGQRWRLSVTIDQSDNNFPERHRAGVVLFAKPSLSPIQYVIQPERGRRLVRDWSKRVTRDKSISDYMTMVVERWDDCVAIFLDGKHVDWRQDPHYMSPNAAIGLGTPHRCYGEKVYFEEPTLQLLTAAPAWHAELLAAIKANAEKASRASAPAETEAEATEAEAEPETQPGTETPSEDANVPAPAEPAATGNDQPPPAPR